MAAFSITSRPGESDALDLDHETMPYAGKFGMESTGTAILEEGDDIVAALSFSPDRTDALCCRIRYLSVSREHQGTGLVGRLVEAFMEWALGDGYRTIKITIINPFAVVALDRLGFGYTGTVGPSGGVELRYPSEDVESVESALATLDERSLAEEHHRYIRRYLEEPDTDRE